MMSAAAQTHGAACQPSTTQVPAHRQRAAATGCAAQRPSVAVRLSRQAGHCIPRPLRLQVRAEAADNGPAAATATAAAAAPIPTRLNTIPHERTTRQHFYRETTSAIKKALDAGETRVTARCTIPELNTEFDVYRVGTLLELVREVACMLAADGKRVKVSVQQALGQGVFQGTPLSLNGVMRIMKQMDWGASKDFIQLGNMGAAEVEGADAFVLISPQNIVGHSIMPLLSEMVAAAEADGKPMVLINPKLGDIQSAGGVMSIRGRQDRLDFVASFATAYHFRLLYKGVAMHPIMGGLRHEYGGPWEVFRRVELGPGKEEYQLIGSFEKEPTPPQITKAFQDAWSKRT